MKRAVILLHLATLFLLTESGNAQQVFNIDPQASQVAFSLEGSAHSTHGTFHVQSGSVSFDRNAAKIGGKVVVAAGSGDSGNGSRDRKMNQEVLDVAHFAEVTFEPKSFSGAIASSGDSTIQVSGIFTLHGTPHEMAIPMQLHVDGPNCTVKTHFMVPYVQWGLKDPSVFILKVAKEVGIDLNLVGHLSPAN